MAMNGDRPADAFVDWCIAQGFITTQDQEDTARAMWRAFCGFLVSELATNAQLRSAVAAASIPVQVTPSTGTGVTTATGSVSGGIQ